jgi:hypothetical protein
MNVSWAFCLRKKKEVLSIDENGLQAYAHRRAALLDTLLQ